MSSTPSIIMFAGEDNYTLASFLDEAEFAGVSKRIPANSIPQGLVPGASKIFIAHPKAIVLVGADGLTLEDLAYRLLEMGFITAEQWADLVDLDMPKEAWQKMELEPFDPVPSCMLDIAYALSAVGGSRLRDLEQEFQISYIPGVIGFSHVTRLEYVLPNDVTELPSNIDPALKNAIDASYVTPVHVHYDDPETTGGGAE